MHELVRQYCAEVLEEESPEEVQRRRERAWDRHSHYYGAFLQEREGRLQGRGQAEAFAEIREEMENMWAAWRWAVERGDVETIGRCVETLAYAGRVRRWYHEMMQAFDDAAAVLRQHLDLTMPGQKGADPQRTALVLADILSRQGLLGDWIGGERGIELLSKESLALLEEMAPGAHRDRVYVHAKMLMGVVLWRSYGAPGDSTRAKQLFQEALAAAEEVGTSWDRVYALFWLGTCASNEGRYPEAEGFLRRAVAIANEAGEQYWKAHSLNRLSWVCWARGDYPRAETVAKESLEISQELEDPMGIGYGLIRLGEIATALGKYDLAARYFQKSLVAVDEVAGRPLEPEVLREQGWLAMALGQYREAEELFRELLANGTTQLIAFASLGQAAFALGEIQEARDYFHQALEGAMQEGSTLVAVSAVMGMASLSARAGDPQRAAELLGLVLDRPVTIQRVRDRAQDLLAELESELSPEALAAAMARGQARELEQVATEILEKR